MNAWNAPPEATVMVGPIFHVATRVESTHTSDPPPTPQPHSQIGDYIHDLNAGRNVGPDVATIHVNMKDTMTWPHATDIEVKSLHELREIIEHALAEEQVLEQQLAEE